MRNDCCAFKGEWSPFNLSGITNILHSFPYCLVFRSNLKKSNQLEFGVRYNEYVKDAANEPRPLGDTIGKLKASALHLENSKPTSRYRRFESSQLISPTREHIKGQILSSLEDRCGFGIKRGNVSFVQRRSKSYLE
ncbi:hypothetical protein Tco_1078659 [Tanacetum coccineum]|uniref:Uncharacterized protein n=1 Tax=Tanacetum coccineum TaxID=301880 RepID=A0ABQ5HPQ4_9ASTR